MAERPEQHESFDSLEGARRELEKHGWFFFPVPKEHTEGLITDPILARVRRAIKRHSFLELAGHSLITFNGYKDDKREVYEIPEARAFWQKLDKELPELPALLGIVPVIAYNGPVMHLSMIGEVDQVVDRPKLHRYDLFIVGADRLIENAVVRIHAAGTKYGLRSRQIYRLISDFMAYTTFPPDYGAPEV